MPSADFSAAFGPPRDAAQSTRINRQRRRPPEVSSTAFAAHLPNLHPSPLMDMDFAVKRPLVRRRLPPSGSCTSGRDCCSPLLSDPPRDGHLAVRSHFTSIRLYRGLPPPGCRTCSAHASLAQSLRDVTARCALFFCFRIVAITYNSITPALQSTCNPSHGSNLR